MRSVVVLDLPDSSSSVSARQASRSSVSQSVGAWMSSKIYFEARVAMEVNTVISRGPAVSSVRPSPAVGPSRQCAGKRVSYQGQGWASRAGRISRRNTVSLAAAVAESAELSLSRRPLPCDDAD